jgi:CheY-like chemotaxis protein
MTEKRLLIVDDEAPIRTTLSHVFARTGYAVSVASDGFSALAEMRADVPDVLLSDLHMPGMSGFELLSVVRRRMPGVYVIATSGAYMGDAVPEGIAADGFYRKASNFGALIAMVEAAMLQAEPLVREAAHTPLWVTRLGGEGGSFGMIGCPDCLRSYAQPLAGSSQTVHETVCRDCGVVIRYAVVKELDPVTSQPYLGAMDGMDPGAGMSRGQRAGERIGRMAPARMGGPMLGTGTAG